MKSINFDSFILRDKFVGDPATGKMPIDNIGVFLKGYCKDSRGEKGLEKAITTVKIAIEAERSVVNELQKTLMEMMELVIAGNHDEALRLFNRDEKLIKMYSPQLQPVLQLIGILIAHKA